MATFAAVAVNAKANAQAALLNGGYLSLYTGSQPATADTAVTTQTRLVRMALSNPAFGAAVAGSVTSIAITPTLAEASGTATWARLTTSAGAAVLDLSVGASGAGTFEVTLNTATVTQGAQVTMNSLTLVEPQG